MNPSSAELISSPSRRFGRFTPAEPFWLVVYFFRTGCPRRLARLFISSSWV